MQIEISRARLVLGVLGIAFAALAIPVAAEVTNVEPDRPEKNVTIPARPLHQSPLRVQCWQDGVEIIDQAGLEGLSIATATRASTVTLKRLGDQQGSVFLVPFAEGLCVIQPAG